MDLMKTMLRLALIGLASLSIASADAQIVYTWNPSDASKIDLSLMDLDGGTITFILDYQGTPPSGLSSTLELTLEISSASELFFACHHLPNGAGGTYGVGYGDVYYAGGYGQNTEPWSSTSMVAFDLASQAGDGIWNFDFTPETLPSSYQYVGFNVSEIFESFSETATPGTNPGFPYMGTDTFSWTAVDAISKDRLQDHSQGEDSLTGNPLDPVYSFDLAFSNVSGDANGGIFFGLYQFEVVVAPVPEPAGYLAAFGLCAAAAFLKRRGFLASR